jgi:hypothetical protein
MLRGSLVAVCGIAFLVAACGGDGEKQAGSAGSPPPSNVMVPLTGTPTTAGPATATTTPASQGTVTAAALNAALLTLQEMPSGWTTEPPSSDDDDSERICNIPPSRPRRLARAEVNFTKSDLGPFFNELINAYERGAAKPLFDDAVQILQTCREWKTMLDGAPVTVKVSPLSFPRVGEQSYAYRATFDSASFPFQVDAVYVRAGDIILVFAHIAVGAGGPDSALTESLVKAAYDKVAKAGLVQ